jgi:hypothetical protein
MSLGFFRNLAKAKPAPVREREHDVAGRTLPLRIVENDRARRLTLRIDAAGHIGPGGRSLSRPPSGLA